MVEKTIPNDTALVQRGRLEGAKGLLVIVVGSLTSGDCCRLCSHIAQRTSLRSLGLQLRLCGELWHDTAMDATYEM